MLFKRMVYALICINIINKLVIIYLNTAIQEGDKSFFFLEFYGRTKKRFHFKSHCIGLS